MSAAVTETKTQSTQAKHTFGSEILTDPYHINTIRSLVTRNLAIRFDEIKDEVASSCEDYIPMSKGLDCQATRRLHLCSLLIQIGWLFPHTRHFCILFVAPPIVI